MLSFAKPLSLKFLSQHTQEVHFKSFPSLFPFFSPSLATYLFIFQLPALSLAIPNCPSLPLGNLLKSRKNNGMKGGKKYCLFVPWTFPFLLPKKRGLEK
jgi:hypothetical protein